MTRRRIAFGLALTLCVAGATFAATTGRSVEGLLAGSQGGVVHVAPRYPIVEGFVPLPMPGDPDPVVDTAPSARGPVATSAAALENYTGASALVGPGGRTFMTAERRTRRDIQRVIRQLD